jgi:hypothetical protein
MLVLAVGLIARENFGPNSVSTEFPMVYFMTLPATGPDSVPKALEGGGRRLIHAPSRHLPGETEETHERLQSG